MGPTALPTLSQGLFSHDSGTSTLGDTVSVLVDFISTTERDQVPRTEPSSDYDRRQLVRVGSPPGSPPGARPMDNLRAKDEHQCARTAGHFHGSKGLRNPCARSGHLDLNRQRNSQGTCEPSWGHPLQGSNEGGSEVRPLGGGPLSINTSGPYLRRSESHSRLSQSGTSRPLRMVHFSSTVSRSDSSFRTPNGGSIRQCHQPPAASVLHQVPLSRGRGGGCPSESVASRSTSLCLSASQPAFQGGTEVDPGTRGTDTHRSLLEPSPLVRRSQISVGGASLADSRRTAGSQAGTAGTSRSALVPSHRVAIERELMTKLPLSAGAIATIQAARRASTTRIYEATWRAFSLWCGRQLVSPTSASIPCVIEFLQEGLVSGLSPNTLRRQVAALSTVLSGSSSEPLSRDSLIRQFLRGATNIRPPTIHRYPSWDLPKVLRALTGPPFEPLRDVSLKYLSFKVAFLVAVTSARRISEMAALSIRKELCIFHQDRVVLRLDPSFIPKVNSVFHRAQEVVLPNFCPNPRHPLEKRWHTLDVRRALKVYVSRTATFRRSDALFVSFLPASLGLKISSTTLGRWIRACISAAYEASDLPVPRRITAHSTRSAATSAAWSTRASIEEICRAAAWTSPSPFVRHYRLDTFASADAAFGRRVLQGVHSTS
ncbi:uncharacterized protein LOC132709142 [Pantherophis guttatus]|uniref:Uncharacterized protein LOC132709142 n=1 Tax=Pantherophis guttatus TaxID=94885 RepID=A0ABM3YPC5_PANGU|nr:uncharacterized protein LOC132709142 [Pantherophis guttatus]